MFSSWVEYVFSIIIIIIIIITIMAILVTFLRNSFQIWNYLENIFYLFFTKTFLWQFVLKINYFLIIKKIKTFFVL